MKPVRQHRACALAVFALAYCLPTELSAQLVSLKTVPIAAGDQFQLFPSQKLGMGGVSIAVDDPLLDPFINPAKGSRIPGALLYTAPVFYNISGDNGAGRSLPAGLLFNSGSFFGAASLSLQELESAERFFGPVPVLETGAPELLSDRAANNVYASALFGGKLPDSRFSLGGSLFWGGLSGVQGVDLLYAGATSIEQSGHVLDVRLGLLGELEGERTYEVMLLYNSFDMTHDVTYVEWVWPEDAPIEPSLQTRVETNLDRTNTYGAHLGYVQPLADEGWRVGGIFTSNYKSHPKIPNYEIQNIPRDPGNTWAFNFGIGVSRSADPIEFGIDLILEPIWSDTWAEADTAVTTRNGGVIKAGGKTVENDFVFTNAIVRMGLGIANERAGVQLGLEVRSIDYQLEQVDRVEVTKRKQDESWTEWTPSLGLALKFPEFQVRYVGRLTTGTGQPGTAWTAIGVERGQALDAASDFIVAPSGPLTLQEADVVTHQITVSLPIGR
jgi:hypothetical protein